MKLIRIHTGDNVAVALAPVEAGEQVSAGGRTLTAAEPIPQGHKLALTDLQPGDIPGREDGKQRGSECV